MCGGLRGDARLDPGIALRAEDEECGCCPEEGRGVFVYDFQ